MKIPEAVNGQLLSSRVAVQLMKEMQRGEFSDAQLLPAEVELATLMGVSRTVIRDALSNLEREGMIERMRGIGTVIHRDIVSLRSRLDLKVEYYELLEALDCVPSSDSVLLRTEAVDAKLAARLRLKEGEELIVREKRVLASGVPVIYSIDYLPRKLMDMEDHTAIDWSRPIFEVLFNHCGITVQSSLTEVKAVIGTEFVREKLNQSPEQALIELRELGCAKMGRPILYTVAYYTDFFDFTVLRKKF